ncbi:MAG: hypothetical protein K940chlam5_01680 [Candidatus Anoxychlamydiales bacterium]|nr:hypothetical protein [Candidatus Anoxychlamydiales bacterium]
MSALGEISGSSSLIARGEPAIIDWDDNAPIKTACHLVSDVATTTLKPVMKGVITALTVKAGCEAPEAITDIAVSSVTDKLNAAYKTCGDKVIDRGCAALKRSC